MSNYFDQITSRIPELLARYRVPGVAFGLLYQGHPESAGFGITAIENGLPVSADTLFQVGSISKTILGTAAMRLVDLGKLDLDVPIRTYLPKFKLQDKRAAAKLSMRHLFTHTGGWLGDYFNDIGWADDALARMLDLIAELPQITPLGKIFSYNNAGFNIAGRVIEVITGMPYEQAIQRLVFDPLGMPNSLFFPWEVMVRSFALGHISPHDAAQPVRIGTPWALGRSSHPAGGVVSSVNDMLTYAQFHLGEGRNANGKRWITKASLKSMQTDQVNAYSHGDAWGLTWGIRQIGSARIVRHGGATRGFNADFRMVPAAGLAMVTLANSDRGSELYDELTAFALKLILNAEKPAPSFMTLPTADLSGIVGVYDAPLDYLKVRKKGNQLLIQSIPKGGFPKPDSPPTGPALPAGVMGFESPSRAIVLDGGLKGSKVDILRDENGHVNILHTGGRAHVRV